MDTRRLIIAMAVSFALLFGWNYVAEKMGWISKPAPVQQTTQSFPSPEAPAAQTQTPRPAGGEQAETFTPTQGTVIEVVTPLYHARFNGKGGILNSFELLRYEGTNPVKHLPNGKHVQLVGSVASEFAPLGLLLNGRGTWRNGKWAYDGPEKLELSSGQVGSLTFTGMLDGVRITREYTINADTYVISEKTGVTAQQSQAVSLGYTISTENISGPEEYQQGTHLGRVENGSYSSVTSKSDLEQGVTSTGLFSWAGNMGTYFLAAMLPPAHAMRLDAKLQSGVFRVAFKEDDANLSPGNEYSSGMSYYFGPKSVGALEKAPNNLTTSIDYGWFGWVAKPLLFLLKFFHGFVNNWGIAIVLLTVLIKMVLWPLSYKSYKSMEAMKKIQPLMAKVREKNKDDKQRMNQEMMQLYKTYKVNPMGGCLPILIQLPIFMGLYRALLYAIELRQASFISYLPFTDIVWLADLSLKDPLYITPIVMGATMFLQQKITPAPGDPTQAKIMMFMPVIFTVMFINFPSGLVVYWLVNSIISIGQQWWQLRGKYSRTEPVPVGPAAEDKAKQPKKGKNTGITK